MTGVNANVIVSLENSMHEWPLHHFPPKTKKEREERTTVVCPRVCLMAPGYRGTSRSSCYACKGAVMRASHWLLRRPGF